MLFLFALFTFIVGFGALLAQLCNSSIFLDEQKQELNQKFETWWNKAKVLKKEKLALLFTKKVADVLDSYFGEKWISKKLVWRCTVLSTGMLMILLSVFAVQKQQTIGVAPWTAYDGSIQMILKVTDELADRNNYASFPVFDVKLAKDLNGSTNMFMFRLPDTNCVLIISTNGISQRFDATAFNNGSIGFNMSEVWHDDNGETNFSGTNVDEAISSQIKDLKRMHEAANSFSAFKYKVYYTVAYYMILFFVTAFSFTISMVFCKIAIREMSKSGGILSIGCLFLTNALIVIVGSGVLMAFFSFISVPFFWVAYPLFKVAAIQSFTLFAMTSVLSGLVLLVAIGASTKLMIFTALIPTFFCGIVAGCSGIAMKWKNAFYAIVKFFLIRLIKLNPFVFVGGILMFLVGLITLVNMCFSIHITFFK